MKNRIFTAISVVMLFAVIFITEIATFELKDVLYFLWITNFACLPMLLIISSLFNYLLYVLRLFNFEKNKYRTVEKELRTILQLYERKQISEHEYLEAKAKILSIMVR